MAGAALGQEVPVKGCCPGSAFPDTAPCPSHRRPPQQGTAGASRVVRHGEKEREKKRQAEAGRSFRQGCSGVLRAGVKVHRGKGRVRGLEGEGHCGGARTSSRQRGIPQKRPLELHREGEKEQERKRERKREGGVSGSSAGGAGRTDTEPEGGGGWAATWQVAGCGQAFGKGATPSQGGALGLLPTSLARLRWHGVRASQPSLTHASRAVLIGLKAPAAALVAAAAVPAIGVDADGLVPRADEGELDALIRVCKQRGLGVRWLGWQLRAAGHGLSGSPCTCWMTPPELATHKPCLHPGGSRHGPGHPATSLLPLHCL